MKKCKTIEDICILLTSQLKGKQKDSYWFGDLENVLRKEDARFYVTSAEDGHPNNFIVRYTYDKSGKRSTNRYKDVYICAISGHCKRTTVTVGPWYYEFSGYHFYYDRFEVSDFSCNDGSVLIQDAIDKQMPALKNAADNEKDKNAAFAKSLKEHGFEDVEALASWIMNNASSEQYRAFKRALR